VVLFGKIPRFVRHDESSSFVISSEARNRFNSLPQD
jgi:hypothetical protein